MNRKPLIAICILSAALIGALGALTWSWMTPRSDAAATSEAVTDSTKAPGAPIGAGLQASPATVNPPTPPYASQPSQEPAPWEKYALPSGSPRIAPNVSKAKAYEMLQAKLAAMTAGGKPPNSKDLDAILAELQQINGSTDVGGVNLAALRNNLARAEEIQRLGKEMQTISQSPTKQDAARLQSLMAEIQQQQAGMVMDIRSKAAAK